MAQIAIVGEAFGAEEERLGLPIVGASGQELTRMLSEAGIARSEVFLTNVFNLRPKDNDLDTLCYRKADLPKVYPDWPAVSTGLYVRFEFIAEIARLRRELEELRPNIVIACGNTAAWALLKQTAISKIRGAVQDSTLVPGLKVLPTYHPAAVIRQWDLRHVTVLDFMKARAESAFPEIRRPARRICVPNCVSDITYYVRDYIEPASRLSFDIETASGQITCIGFAPSLTNCLVIPFVDHSKPDKNYWPALEIELEVWKKVRYILGLPLPKFGQNGLYDMQYLWQGYRIPVRNYSDDTMLLHHALMPESPKGLDFLGSVYANEGAWKQLRSRGKHTTKREE